VKRRPLIPDPDDPLTRLEVLRWVRDDAQLGIDEAVADAREWGYTWVQIGRALGVTKQAAQGTYGETSG
jgi:hypothetical protein